MIDYKCVYKDYDEKLKKRIQDLQFCVFGYKRTLGFAKRMLGSNCETIEKFKRIISNMEIKIELLQSEQKSLHRSVLRQAIIEKCWIPYWQNIDHSDFSFEKSYNDIMDELPEDVKKDIEEEIERKKNDMTHPKSILRYCGLDQNQKDEAQ